MRQSARCPSRRRARRGIGISTAFFRPDFKGGRARSRTCVRGRRWKWTSGIRRVIVHTFRGKTALPCLPIAQPDGPVFGERTRSKAKGEPRRSIEGKMTPWPCVPWLEAVAREPRLDRDCHDRDATSLLLSSLLWTEKKMKRDKFAFRPINSHGF